MISDESSTPPDLEKMLSIARRSIEVEITTLVDLNASLDQSFFRSLTLIHQASGRLICTGVGKSSLIAQKIVATFNSTGTPAIFMHGADAIHGDLGILQPGDVVMCLSKSGETVELLRLIPAIRKKGNRIIGVISNPESTLAKSCDFVILTPIRREAEPNDLAPTSSAMAQLAIGDALTACLIVMKGFRSRDFAHLHPGGQLGKRLLLTVADVAQLERLPRVTLNDSLKQIIIEISSKRLGATAVVDEQGALKGIITDGDLRRMLETKEGWQDLCAQEIMTTSPKTISLDALAIEALKSMQQHNITQLLITDEAKFVGVVHIHDLLKEGLG